MVGNQRNRLFGRALWLFAIAGAAALVAAQWQGRSLPVAAICVVLVLTVIKARIVILDFMGLRTERPRMAAAMIAWPAFFSVLVAAKAAIPLFGG